MSKRLVFFGHGGSYNHGCEAIVRSTVNILGKDPIPFLYTNSVDTDREFLLDHEVMLMPQRRPFVKSNPLDLAAMAFRKLLKLDFLYLWRFFGGKMDNVKDSLCVSIGGDMYCYGKLSWLYHTHRRLKKNHNTTMLWGCSVDDGSFFKESLEDLRRYDKIIVRESLSYELFKQHGFKNVKLYPDPAFTLPSEPAELPFAFEGSNTVAINMSPLMHRFKDGSPLDESFTGLIDYILANTSFSILLLPHVNGDAAQEDDYSYLKGYYDLYSTSGRVELVGRQYNCRQLKDIISKCRFLVTARTHASIAAYSTCVPTLVVGYSTKSKGIATDIFGTDENYVIPVQAIERSSDLSAAFEWLCKNENNIKEHLARVMPEYIQKAYSAKQEITELL